MTARLRFRCRGRSRGAFAIDRDDDTFGLPERACSSAVRAIRCPASKYDDSAFAICCSNCSSFVMTPISHLAAANSTGGLNGYTCLAETAQPGANTLISRRQRQTRLTHSVSALPTTRARLRSAPLLKMVERWGLVVTTPMTVPKILALPISLATNDPKTGTDGSGSCRNAWLTCATCSVQYLRYQYFRPALAHSLDRIRAIGISMAESMPRRWMPTQVDATSSTRIHFEAESFDRTIVGAGLFSTASARPNRAGAGWFLAGKRSALLRSGSFRSLAR